MSYKGLTGNNDKTHKTAIPNLQNNELHDPNLNVS